MEISRKRGSVFSIKGNAFLAFMHKEFLHIFRDVRSMVILFGIPIVQIMLFGYVITTDISDATIGFVDLSRDEMTIGMKNKLLSSGYFKENIVLNSQKEIDAALKSGKVRLVVVFEPNFAQRLQKENKANMQIIADAAEPNTASLLVNFTSAVCQDYIKAENPSVKALLPVSGVVRMMYNEELKSVFMFVPGTMALILMIISALMTSVSIAREKELGTMELLLVSPLKPIQIILGKVMPYLVLSVINAVVIIGLGHYIFDLPIRGSVLLLMAECLLFITTALSLGIMISTLVESQQVAMMISLFVLMLPTMMLSGFIFPIENMPLPLRTISNIVPPKWFIIIVKGIMIKGNDFWAVLKETLVLLGMAIFFILMSVKNFKIRLS